MGVFPPCAEAEGITKEVAQLREAAGNDMLLDEGSSLAAVLDELHHLLTQLKAHADNLARINKYQQLFQVQGSPSTCEQPNISHSAVQVTLMS